MASTSRLYHRRRSTQISLLALLVLLLLLVCSLNRYPETTTTSQHGICLVRAEAGGEVEDDSTEEDEAIIDAMTGESILPHDDEGVYAPSMLHNDGNMNRYSSNMEERDPNLRLMTYDVGDGEQTTYVYVEPTIEEMYRSTVSDQEPRVQRVTPQFNGFAGKFINMSNKKCTLYWYVYYLFSICVTYPSCSVRLDNAYTNVFLLVPNSCMFYIGRNMRVVRNTQ
jgi:hypothetical protein